MHPQDIRAGQGAVQLMQNALQNQAHAQDKATQAFDRLSENAFNFAKYFENKQRYQEEKALREQAYNDEKAYREQRDKINDERYTNEFNENKRRYDNDYAIKNKVANAQINLYGKQARAQQIANLVNEATGATELLASKQNLNENDNKTIGDQVVLDGHDKSIIALVGDEALRKEQTAAIKQGGNKNKITLNSKPTPTPTTNTPPQTLAQTNNRHHPTGNKFLDK